MNAVLRRIQESIRRRSDLSYDVELSPEKSFIKDLNYDSLDLAELILDIENDFNIEIANIPLNNFKTIAGLILVVERLR